MQTSSHHIGGMPPSVVIRVGGQFPSSSHHARCTQPFTASLDGSTNSIENPIKIGHKIKFPCDLCKGDHLIHISLGILEVLKVWSSSQGSSSLNPSIVSQQPMSPTSGNHVEDKPSTNENEVQGNKEKVKFPCILFMGYHFTHHFPHKDESS